MTWANWIPAFVTTGALAALGWLLRVPLQKAIESAIGSAFDEKLERLRAELRERGAEIDALRSGAFANFAARQAELGRRRLLAVERVWAEVTELGKFEHLSTFAQSLNVDEIIKATSNSAIDRKKMSDFATILLGDLADPKAKPFEATANRERPFVPELTFALFLSFRQIVLWPYLFLQSCRLEGDLRLLKPEPLLDLARKALPHQGPFLDQYGAGGLPFLVEELKSKVLASLREALDQKDSDEAAVAQAKAIIEAVKASNPRPKPVTPPEL